MRSHTVFYQYWMYKFRLDNIIYLSIVFKYFKQLLEYIFIRLIILTYNKIVQIRLKKEKKNFMDQWEHKASSLWPSVVRDAKRFSNGNPGRTNLTSSIIRKIVLTTVIIDKKFRLVDLTMVRSPSEHNSLAHPNERTSPSNNYSNNYYSNLFSHYASVDMWISRSCRLVVVERRQVFVCTCSSRLPKLSTIHWLVDKLSRLIIIQVRRAAFAPA